MPSEYFKLLDFKDKTRSIKIFFIIYRNLKNNQNDNDRLSALLYS